MNVSLLTYTPEPEAVVAAAAKVCCSSMTLDDIITKAFAEDNESYLGKLADAHHESPLEHASFTFAVEGVSRSLLAQLTRHRIASYSVRSQRYVSEKGFDRVIPPEIAKDAQAAYIFDGAMGAADAAYKQLVEILTTAHAKSGMRLVDAKKESAGRCTLRPPECLLHAACVYDECTGFAEFLWETLLQSCTVGDPADG